MLSEEEKKEMLEDGLNTSRKDNFNFVKQEIHPNVTFDNYLVFLNDIQEIFSPFVTSKKTTQTQFNKL